MRNLLITGANGFVGSNALSYFHGKYNIIAVSRVSPKIPCKWIKFDITNFEFLKQEILLSKPDFILHCASIAHKKIDKKFYLKKECHLVNIEFTKLLIDCCIKNKTERFIYLSSIGVMALSNRHMINESTKVSKDNLYSFYKFESEALIKNKLQKNNVFWTILRPPIIYGPNPPGNLRLLKFAIDFNLPLIVEKNGLRRSFLGIENLLSSIEKIININNGNKTYVISDDQTINFKELIQIISSARKKDALIINFPKIIYRFFTYLPILGKKFKILSNEKCYVIDNTFIKKDLDWKPEFNLKRKMFEYFRK